MDSRIDPTASVDQLLDSARPMRRVSSLLPLVPLLALAGCPARPPVTEPVQAPPMRVTERVEALVCTLTLTTPDGEFALPVHAEERDAVESAAQTLGRMVSALDRFLRVQPALVAGTLPDQRGEVDPELVLGPEGGSGILPPGYAVEVSACEAIGLSQPMSASWAWQAPQRGRTPRVISASRSAGDPASAVEAARRLVCTGHFAHTFSASLSELGSVAPAEREALYARQLPGLRRNLFACFGEGRATYGRIENPDALPPVAREARSEGLYHCRAQATGPRPSIQELRLRGAGVSRALNASRERALQELVASSVASAEAAAGDAIASAAPDRRASAVARAIQSVVQVLELHRFAERDWLSCQELVGSFRWGWSAPGRRCIPGRDETLPVSRLRDAERARRQQCAATAALGWVSFREGLESVEDPLDRQLYLVAGAGEVQACGAECLGELRPQPRGRRVTQPRQLRCRTEDEARAALRDGIESRDLYAAIACLDSRLAEAALDRLVSGADRGDIIDQLRRLRLQAHRRGERVELAR